LFAPPVELVPKDRRGERRVDESPCDHVDSNRGKLEGKASRQGRHGGADCGDEWLAVKITPALA
jgi:hypothetical protein